MNEVFTFLGFLVGLIGLCATVHYGRKSSSPPSNGELHHKKNEE